MADIKALRLSLSSRIVHFRESDTRIGGLKRCPLRRIHHYGNVICGFVCDVIMKNQILPDGL
ncbi:MAG TPA: hypothetical protein ACFYD4_10680 [Candidatus Wunengus sp. YC61]|uniref:hypothetical protein n=1 Tax=Candidatus Wunengus sp. YC61 TaxID=3367698 RepID=UPI0040288F71